MKVDISSTIGVNSSVSLTIYQDETGDNSSDVSETKTLSGGDERLDYSSLTYNTSYNYSTKLDFSNSDISNAGEVQTIEIIPNPPSAPTSVSVTSNENVTISWSAGSNEDGFYIYRATSSGASKEDYTQIADVSDGSTSHTDTGLKHGEKYFYRVSAYNVTGESSLSSEVSTVTELPAPSGLSLDASTDREIGLSWTNNHNNGSVTAYRGTSSGSLSTSLSVSGNSHTDTGLLDGEKYFYQVEVSTEHASASTTEVSAVTNLPTPTNVSGSYVSNEQIDMSWDDVANNGN